MEQVQVSGAPLSDDLCDAYGVPRGSSRGEIDDAVRPISGDGESGGGGAAPLSAEQAQLRDEVVRAAEEWMCERSINDWSEADLARAVIRFGGDWPGCPGCDFECDEPCMPATVEVMLNQIDCRIAQLVHDGKLARPVDYAPPEGWTPWTDTRKRLRDELVAERIARADASITRLSAEKKALAGAIREFLTAYDSEPGHSRAMSCGLAVASMRDSIALAATKEQA